MRKFVKICGPLLTVRAHDDMICPDNLVRKQESMMKSNAERSDACLCTGQLASKALSDQHNMTSLFPVPDSRSGKSNPVRVDVLISKISAGQCHFTPIFPDLTFRSGTLKTVREADVKKETEIAYKNAIYEIDYLINQLKLRKNELVANMRNIRTVELTHHKKESV